MFQIVTNLESGVSMTWQNSQRTGSINKKQKPLFLATVSCELFVTVAEPVPSDGFILLRVTALASNSIHVLNKCQALC